MFKIDDNAQMKANEIYLKIQCKTIKATQTTKTGMVKTLLN